jgi:methylated-DNA-[protein]-cysteine S-methyltransferase
MKMDPQHAARQNFDTREQAIRAGLITPGMSFDQKVWAITSRIPRGSVVTYGQIARALRSRAYRAVGSALNRNPYAPGVPCHRVVGSDGKLTGYAGGLAKKRRMLIDEGVTVVGDRVDLSCVHPLTKPRASRTARKTQG